MNRLVILLAVILVGFATGFAQSLTGRASITGMVVHYSSRSLHRSELFNKLFIAEFRRARFGQLG
jgi:hypothetical protein